MNVKPEKNETQKEQNLKTIFKTLYFKRNGNQTHLRELLGCSFLFPGPYAPAAKVWADWFLILLQQ